LQFDAKSGQEFLADRQDFQKKLGQGFTLEKIGGLFNVQLVG
jgi:hypothetical protein